MKRPHYFQCAKAGASTYIRSPLSHMIETTPCVMGVVYHDDFLHIVPTRTVYDETDSSPVPCFVLDDDYLPIATIHMSHEALLIYIPAGVWDFKLLFARDWAKVYDGYYPALFSTLPHFADLMNQEEAALCQHSK